jgi:hypothetical protein
MGKTVAESLTPAGSGTAGLLLMKAVLLAPSAGAGALALPLDGAPGFRLSDGM